MKRIEKLFQNKNKEILSIYFTAGYPKIDDTVSIIETLEKKGIDLIEIGIPFSDPMADGVVIQQSSQMALKNGMTLRKLFTQLSTIREAVKIPLVMMGYLNPILQFGFEDFCKECSKIGIDGMIIPDLPMNDYLQFYKPIAEKHNLNFIFLITPETSEERIRQIDDNTNGFIYMVSSAAITGTQQSFSHQINYFERIKNMYLKNPRLIGFGVSNKATKEMTFQYASGAIVGSAFIKTLSTANSIEKAVDLLLEQLSE